jgi:hypothetical protein
LNFFTLFWSTKEALISTLTVRNWVTELAPPRQLESAENFNLDEHFVKAKNLEPQISKFVRAQIEQLRTDYGTGRYRFPYSALIQASGVGKSYHLSQMRYHGAWLFYMCFRPIGSQGFPLRSSMADFYINPVEILNLKPVPLKNQDWAKVAYRCFYEGCLIELKHWIIRKLKECMEQPPEDILQSLQGKWGEQQLSKETADKFWDRILKRTKSLFSAFFNSFQDQLKQLKDEESDRVAGKPLSLFF